MRQLFASPRIENVERLDAVLREAGIATRVTNQYSFLTGRPRFGYSERGVERKWPALWVVEAEDFPRARQLLRDAGLLETRGDAAYYRGPTEVEPPRAPDHAAKRIRLILFAVVFVLTIVTLIRMFLKP